MTAIIILNWNGAEDTINCLESLYNISLEEEYFIVVVDNGSEDNSLQDITIWFSKKNIFYHDINFGDLINFPSKILTKESVLLRLDRNYGFAKGNNCGIRFVTQYFPDYILLLNNDTEVENDFLVQLKSFYLQNIDYKILTPVIRYYNSKNIIWNCGGKLFWGFRKYYYQNKPISQIKEKEFIAISFVTGCCLFFHRSLLDENNCIFTEDFFFGEEDFDLSLRMKKDKIKMACVINSNIYHKVSASTSNMNLTGKLYMYYLNRFINVRKHFSKLSFFFWTKFYLCYIFFILIKYRISFKNIFSFLKRLIIDSKKKDQVTKEDFSKIISVDKYFRI